MIDTLLKFEQFFSIYADKGAVWVPELLAALKVTLTITFGSFVVGVLLGVCIAICRLSKRSIARRFGAVYVEITRGVPALVILFLLYYGLVPLGLILDAIPTAIIAIGFTAGGYIAEIFRAAILSIHRGQREAALTVGLTPLATYRYIILPQALRVAVPPLMNILVSLLKDSSLASLISAPELMLRARDIAAQEFMPLHVAILVGVIYLLLSIPLSLLATRLERYLGSGLRART